LFVAEGTTDHGGNLICQLEGRRRKIDGGIGARREIIDANGTVTIIDADPNQPIRRWAETTGEKKGLKVVGGVDEETIVDTIEMAAKESAFVIIDLEGSANLMVGYAISRSDLVLVPVQGSYLDAEEGAKSIQLIKHTAKGFKTKIDYAVLLSRTNTAIQERTLRDVVEGFNDAGVDVMKVQMIDRAAFRSIFAFGGTIHDLNKSEVSGLDNAKENAAAFVEEVIARLNPKKVKARKRRAA